MDTTRFKIICHCRPCPSLQSHGAVLSLWEMSTVLLNHRAASVGKGAVFSFNQA